MESTIVNRALVVFVFPQASDAMKVTNTFPAAPHSRENSMNSPSIVHPMSLHASDAIAPPCASNQAFSSARLPPPSHATMISVADTSMTGAALSTPVTRAVVLLMPQSSLTEKVTNAVPVPPQLSLREVKLWVQ